MGPKYDLRLEVFQGKDKQWYWHLKASNGRVICQGEGHPRRRVARLAAINCIDKIRERHVRVFIGDDPDCKDIL